jgi:hypothetical protein
MGAFTQNCKLPLLLTLPIDPLAYGAIHVMDSSIVPSTGRPPLSTGGP